MSEAQVMGGYKATLSNPNVGEEAKQHAQDVLDGKAEPNSKSSSSGGSSEESADGAPSNRVLGGHKAAIHNDSVPEESKEHSRQVLKDAGVEIDE